MQVFVDLNGVLADFDTHHQRLFGIRPSKQERNVDWARIRATDTFYAEIPPMPDMSKLWSLLSRLSPRPIVLTGVPAGVDHAEPGKRQWVQHHLGPDIEVRCCPAGEKCLHARPGDVLVDNWEKYRQLWLARGGRWITHLSASTTIQRLRAIGIGSNGLRPLQPFP